MNNQINFVFLSLLTHYDDGLILSQFFWFLAMLSDVRLTTKKKYEFLLIYLLIFLMVGAFQNFKKHATL